MVNRDMNIMVTKYDENWNELYKKEALKIREIFNGELVDIHHIGSTAVPHLKAKPIIDIMPVVNHVEKVDDFNEQMIEIGYEPLGELGIVGRRYFRKGGENRTHQIHFFQNDNKSEIERHLAVRDYLKSHSEDRNEYGNLKERLAQQFPKDIERYSEGKNDFVQDLERKAMEWKRNHDR
ncbi:GrpB family protein [Halobacillus sp. A1]|uniref:GrpB family protein n=1 Tax=Halobacillus sp. A1 TaxID=2880262 RepID=UPI0020A6AD79|nr:GrpB family protein [Halobacillus sp. A1]MCP3032272.1 GrpB family protein [Halobacillus sp. A1]